MYGYFKPNRCKLKKEDLDFYMKTYCGQCGYLQKNFGYLSRATVSYDSTFFSLLINCQKKHIEEDKNIFCAIAPIKKQVFKLNSSAQVFSANISILLFEAMLLDKMMEDDDWITSKTYNLFSKQFKKSKENLDEIGFESDMFYQAIVQQDKLEKNGEISIEYLSEPTAILISRIFSFTACITKNDNNIKYLKSIGYNLGKIIYITDACVDIKKDYKEGEFNPILNVSHESLGFNAKKYKNNIENIIKKSWIEVQYNLDKLIFSRKEKLIKDIIYSLRRNILLKIKGSYIGIKKKKETPIHLNKYLPHMAIISGLCLVNSVSEASDLSSSLSSVGCSRDCGEDCGECCGECGDSCGKCCTGCGECCGDCCGGCYDCGKGFCGGLGDFCNGFCRGCKT